MLSTNKKKKWSCKLSCSLTVYLWRKLMYMKIRNGKDTHRVTLVYLNFFDHIHLKIWWKLCLLSREKKEHAHKKFALNFRGFANSLWISRDSWDPWKQIKSSLYFSRKLLKILNFIPIKLRHVRVYLSW